MREELATGERLGLVPIGDWSGLTLLEPTEAERLHAAELGGFLEAGEALCLAIGEARGALVLTDDREARRAAAALNLKVSGTIGALVKLVRQEILTRKEGETLLVEMISKGYRSPVRSLAAVVPES